MNAKVMCVCVYYIHVHTCIYDNDIVCSRVWSWPHADGMKTPLFPEDGYEVVRHAFFKVPSINYCTVGTFPHF